MKLSDYKKKRDFNRSPEPRGSASTKANQWRFVIQKHHASHLHYDLRLELDGVLKSWAVPKGPSLDPAVKRLAIEVEDHPLDYAAFEGIIPSGYGAGSVIVWDRGHWRPQVSANEGYELGKLTFKLEGEKLKGNWKLVRTKKPGSGQRQQWLFMKLSDEYARPQAEFAVTEELPRSVVSGKTIEEIGNSNEPAREKKKSSPRRSATKHASSQKDRATARATSLDPAQVQGARRAPWPRSVKPQLAVLGTEAPAGDDWCHEIKFDGYRLLAHIRDGTVQLKTRNGLDWTSKFKSLVPALAALPVENAILDGEVVVLDAQGRSDFQMLQNHLKAKDASQLTLYLFDVPYCDGHDLSRCPLLDRKQLLAQILAGTSATGNVHYTDHLIGNAHAFVDRACEIGLEGIISKRINSPYRFARSPDWLKTKCLQRQEFLIIGYTAPKGSRAGFGALLLGVHEGDRLVYCGRVGTGFDDAGLRELKQQLAAIEVDDPPLDKVPTEVGRGAKWTRPVLIAEVKFTAWTQDGRLRHPVFVALRQDKKPKQIVREQPMKVNIPKPKAGSVKIAGVTITHPDRVVYPDHNITKQAVVEYYEAVADHMLPYVIHRPLVLVRCPSGPGGQCFYQRNLTGSFPKGVVGLEVEDKDGPSTCVAIENRQGLIALIQMGVLEIHPWGSRGDNVEQPDQIIFDLDPAPEVEWDRVVEAAQEIRAVLTALDLGAFVKTSGGKGLHIVVPLRRGAEWDAVKDFAAAVAGNIARAAPDHFTATMSKAKRTGRIFIDHFRNGRGATAIAPYSTRAKATATVSAPLSWDELAGTASNEKYTVLTMPKRLAKQQRDPWESFNDERQALTKGRQRAATDAAPSRKTARRLAS